MIDEMNYYGNKHLPFLFIIDFDMKKPMVLPLHELTCGNVLYDINGTTNAPYYVDRNPAVEMEKFPISFARYKEAFKKIQEYESKGDSYLCNLTLPTPVVLNCTLIDVFYSSVAPYRLYYNGEFVVFSPEPFVKIHGTEISSYPMKGTINASIPGAEDTVLNDGKEFAEHVTIVDLIRNDLNSVASDVTVERFRYVERIDARGASLLQVSSKITGKLHAGYHSEIGSIIAALLPAGSVTGAPKKRTVEIIREVEGYPRGYYTGIFGYFDGTVLDSGVMIRYIESERGALYYKSGGGITVYSSVESEYQELIDKVYVPVV
jgi:para-aminobenzoate synthetase component I